ncbi:hypothetical protein TL16_g02034 [Triparma laevis f. inornata]|uniref:Uncharacterized protein n=1 Tax=Triparma laevis f. inornata TaxID=1714386 RepID=A0A9W6ZSX5_9STRA|nr:hypothetical protein TL16_g02034 [Triparma laevis f. inornata]
MNDSQEYARKIRNPSLFLKEQIDAGLGLDEEIEIATATGSKKVIVGKLYERMKKNEEKASKMENVNGKLQSSEEGILNNEELNDPKNANIKRFMVLGQYAHAIIKSVGYADGDLKNLETSPRYEAVLTKKMYGKEQATASDMPTLLILTIQEANNATVKYEVEFEIDKKYAHPHAALINGWVLADNESLERGKEMVLPYPTLAPVLFGYPIDELESFCKSLGALFVILGLVTWVSGKYFGEPFDKKEEEGGGKGKGKKSKKKD